jgi:hypothetical protein
MEDKLDRAPSRHSPFTREYKLRDYVLANIDKLDLGPLHSGLQGPILEYKCWVGGRGLPIGKIDALLIDRHGKAIAIEFKATFAKPVVLGQLLGYMAWLEAHFPSIMTPVRGVIVAESVSPILISAVRMLPALDISVYVCREGGEIERLV